MTTSTMARSAYPPPVAELLPRAHGLADELGEVPSRNRLMRELRVGADKARAVRAALLDHADPAARTTPDLAPGPVEATPQPVELVPDPNPPAPSSAPLGSGQAAPVADPGAPPGPGPATDGRSVRSWPLVLLALPAFVAIWSGWVGLGGLTGFGIVHPLPGIADRFSLNTAITLPVGVETYAAYALRVWLSGTVPGSARRYAKWSAIGSLLLGVAGQAAYHLMAAAHVTHAPPLITTLVASLPVVVLGMGAALAHLIRRHC